MAGLTAQPGGGLGGPADCKLHDELTNCCCASDSVPQPTSRLPSERTQIQQNMMAPAYICSSQKACGLLMAH
jgi:hypothetical protein